MKIPASILLRLLPLLTMLAASGRSDDRPAVTGEHVVVARIPGYTLAWPANFGLAWRWGDEILVGYAVGVHQYSHRGAHTFDGSKPYEAAFARSLDGGRTWTIERPPSHAVTVKPEKLAFPPGGEPVEPKDRINFAHPDFAMICLMEGTRKDGRAWIQYSYNRGRTWSPRYWLPKFGYDTLHARTDYIVNGRDDCQIQLTGSLDPAAAINSMEVFTARTTDGGLHWQREGNIGTGRSNMPSTVRLNGQTLVTAIRTAREINPAKPLGARNRNPYIEIHVSRDNGKSWQLLATHDTWKKDSGEDHDGDHGNPPSLVKLQDGRLLLTYARRGAYRVCAKLSGDGGATWGPELVLRSNAGSWDVGYTRTTQRDDGKMVTVYYWTDGDKTERYIAATLWDLPGR
jgi:hypothetical protein